MKQHYRLNDIEWEKLSIDVSTMDLMKAIPEFDPHGNSEPMNKLSLMHYIDRHGDFTEGDEKHKKIARAVFGSLNSGDKVDIFKYLDWRENSEAER